MMNPNRIMLTPGFWRKVMTSAEETYILFFKTSPSAAGSKYVWSTWACDITWPRCQNYLTWAEFCLTHQIMRLGEPNSNPLKNGNGISGIIRQDQGHGAQVGCMTQTLDIHYYSPVSLPQCVGIRMCECAYFPVGRYPLLVAKGRRKTYLTLVHGQVV